MAAHTYVVGGAVRNFLLGEPVKDLGHRDRQSVACGRDAEWFANKILLR